MRIKLEIIGNNNYNNNNTGSDKVRRDGNLVEAICADGVNVLDGYVNAVQNSPATSSRCGKAIPLQAWTGPEGSRTLRLPDFKTIGT